MDFFVWQRSIVTEAGDVLASASVSVTDVVSGSLAQLYSDEGVTGIGNPITADANGFARFYVKSGIYDIVATSGVTTRTWSDEAIGSPHKISAAEIAASVTPTNYQHLECNALRYGTNTTPGTTDMAAAIQAAIDVAVAQADVGAEVFIPPGNYRINTSLEITGAVNGIKLRGAGADATTLVNGVTGAAADPMLLINTNGNFHVIESLSINGNGLTTSGGNGHAIALINPGVTLAPNVVCLRDVVIRDHAGTGQDDAASSVPSCGVYAFQLTSLTLDNVYITGCDMGFRGDTIEDSTFYGVLIDDCSLNCVYLEDSFGISFNSCTFQAAGSNGSTDGNVYLNGCENISFFGGEMKNGWPYLLNTQGSAQVNHNVLFKGMALAQLDDAMGHTAIRANNATMNLAFENCRFNFVNTMTDAKGIEVIQAASGWSTTGLRIVGNSFKIGSGGTIAACIHLNVTSNRVIAPVIESNEIGWQDSTGSATVITDGILLDGNVEGGVIRSNAFMTTANLTLTDALHINSSGVLGLRLQSNEYQGTGGTLTNQVNNSAGVHFERRDRAHDGNYLPLVDSVSTVGVLSGQALIFVDTADGDLKVRFGDGTLKLIVTDT